MTLWLLSTASLLALAIAVPVAIRCARHRGGFFDHITRLVGTAGLAMPAFWIGVMLLLGIALPTGWFPTGGFGDTFPDKLRSIVLPAVTLAIGMAPVLIRSLRQAISEVLSSEQVATARSLGLSERRVLSKFVLRNASVSSVTILALEIGYLLFGAVVVETTFALPGLGQGLVRAAKGRDLTAVQGYTLVFAVCVVATFLLADIVTAMLDPRVKITS
ncbi:MAG: ABC transporter permease [Microthrixaceae bacterium]